MLITFEGIDGSGKSTQAQRLVQRLTDAGYAVLLVREPGGTLLAERVRALLLDPDLDPDPFAELLLFSAARSHLVARRIRPALEAGQVVVCDRFYDSTLAYQGGGRGVADVDWLEAFQQRVTGRLMPDRTYLVEVPAAVAQARRSRRGVDDRMEAEGTAFLERVAAAYDRLAERAPQRIVRLDGTQPPGAVHLALWNDLQSLLPLTASAPPEQA